MTAALLLIGGLAGVIFGANWLVEGSCAVAKRLRVSELAIGLTVVAFGTSLPELTVNVFAAAANQPDVAIGNVAGSNIANILLILGVSSMLNPLQVGRGTVWKEIPLCFLASVVLLIFCMDPLLDGADKAILSRSEGLVLLGFFVIFLYYTVGIAHELPGLSEHSPAVSLSTMKIVLMILAGLICLIAGGKAVVEGAVRLAAAAGLSKGFIAATVVAVGTSVPELATSVVAAFKKKADIAIGNVVGSNIFNVFLVLGISPTIRPLEVASELIVSLLAGIAATGLLFVCMSTGNRHKIDRWEGAVLLVLYVVYLVLQAG